MKINAFLWWSWNGSLSHFCKRQRLQKSLNQLSPLTSHLVHWSFKRLTWYFLDKMFYNPLHVCVDWPNPTLSLHGIRDQRGGCPENVVLRSTWPRWERRERGSWWTCRSQFCRRNHRNVLHVTSCIAGVPNEPFITSSRQAISRPRAPGKTRFRFS